MCCIFTCCGWMVDLIQRVWTFSMSCIIMSAVIGVMTTASMSGIALGYNYSLAEYIDLKETNVSVYLKRGVFDDEIADDMEWRRAGHLPVAGQINDDNLMTGAPADEQTTLRSGRRLDDSVFDADDHNKYEGSLMKLTAKPLHLDQTTVMTEDLEMAESITKYPMGSLDQMKAIQSLIDSRRAMATGGSTGSPLATYADAAPLLPFLPSENNPNILMHPEVHYRRMMAPPSGSRNAQPPPPLNPARFAVPPVDVINDRTKWVIPKYPNAFVQTTLDDFFRTSPTYPTAVTVRPMLVRPTEEVNNDQPPPGAVMFPYHCTPRPVATTQPPPLRQNAQEQGEMDLKPDFYNEKVLMEGDELSKAGNQYKPKIGSWGKSPEEEYEDEIKGLPVRKRRSIIASAQVGESRNSIEINNKDTRNNGNIYSIKNIFTSQKTGNEIDNNYNDIFAINKNRSIVEVSNDSETAIKISHKDNTMQQMDSNEKHTLDLENKHEIIREYDRDDNKKGQSLLEYLVKSIETKKASLVAETAPNAGLVKSSAEDIRINTKINSFESKIVPTKYVSNNLATRLEKKQPFNNKGILNSITVGLKHNELLRNPASSKFVKVLQST